MGNASERAALIRPDAPKPSLAQQVAALVTSGFAAQSQRWRLWAPVAFGGGCGLYFSLKSEPALWGLALAAVLACGVWWLARRRGLGRLVTVPLMLLACLALGMAAAKLRAERVAGPIAPAMSSPGRLEAWVVDVDSPGSRGARIVIAPVWVSGLTPQETPLRLRATVKGEPPPPGAPIRLFVLLNPPPAPASPGAYDFGRGAYFQGLGGVAFGLGETRPAMLEPPPWGLRLQMAVNGARYELAQRIVARLGERTGGIAAAMVTGHETWIQNEDLNAMRDSGLAHILSISGLHMAVVGGFVFFMTRLSVAAWPWLALRVSGKKVAAVAGLVAVLSYLVVSGSPAPAERSAITASIAFIAILLDRAAITMNGLAIAALIVLAVQPEAIVTPGFQMSFAATAALVALAENWPRRVKEISAPWPILAVQRFGGWIFAACMASLVAGLATGPFAMQHFNRTAVYGLLANLATSPIADFVMMPALAVGAALEPLGLGAPFLWLAGKGVDLMLAIGHWTARLPGAVQTIASAPDFTLSVAFLGVLMLCLWRGRGRWLGLPLALAVMLWPRAPTPDLWIGDGGANAAFHREKEAVLVRPRVRVFAADLWARRRGLTLTERASEGWTCKRSFCAPQETGQSPVALWWGNKPPTPEVLEGMCASAPVVSSRALLPVLPSQCDGRLVLDRRDFARGGAVELWRTPQGWKARWAADVRGDRPWSRIPSLDDSDPD